jgi:hypothetical protein
MAKRNKCATKYCRNERIEGRKKCAKCRTREWRKKNPLKAAFDRKRTNARRRGIPFLLTYEDFILVYVPGLVLDRNDCRNGYELGNILPLSAHDNAVKGATIDKQRWQKPLDDCPF